MAKALGVPLTTVQYWDEQGVIPTRRQGEVLHGAAENGIDLNPADFFDLPNNGVADA